MPLNPYVKHINRRLIDEFGYLLDKPRFRIVWTGDEYEKRLADYEDWSGNILIRRVNEVREVQKYPYVNPPWWMLERAVEFQDDSVKVGNCYEPLYLFRHFNKNGEYGELLPVNEEMALFAAKCSLAKRPKRNYEMDEREYEEQLNKREQDTFDKLRHSSSDLLQSFAWKEAVTVPELPKE